MQTAPPSTPPPAPAEAPTPTTPPVVVPVASAPVSVAPAKPKANPAMKVAGSAPSKKAESNPTERAFDTNEDGHVAGADVSQEQFRAYQNAERKRKRAELVAGA